MQSYTDRALAQSPETAQLSPEEREFLRRDSFGIESNASDLIYALIAIRTGQWVQRDTTDFGDQTVPGAGQRQLMQTALHTADQLTPASRRCAPGPCTASTSTTAPPTPRSPTC